MDPRRFVFPVLLALAACDTGPTDPGDAPVPAPDAAPPEPDDAGTSPAPEPDALVPSPEPVAPDPSDFSAAPDADAVEPLTPTWAVPVEGFFASYCVECHSSSPKDFGSRDDVAAWSAKIRCGVSPEVESGCGSWPPPAQFPVGSGPKPTDDERRAVVEWIDLGMPE